MLRISIAGLAIAGCSSSSGNGETGGGGNIADSGAPSHDSGRVVSDGGHAASKDAATDSATSAGSGGCVVDGMSYAAAAPNPNNACETCDPTASTSSWTNVLAGMACGGGQVCDGAGSCAQGCFLDGMLYMSGSANPSNACQNCSPSVSTSSWATSADGTSCDTGKICSAGACTAGCLIGGMLYSEGQANPVNACQTCQAGATTSDWTPAADGSSCGNGQICGSGTCGTQCNIDGMTYASGTVSPGNACLGCEPGMSTSAWTNLPDGSTCGSGQTCSAGQCVTSCTDGLACNDSNPCKIGITSCSTGSQACVDNGNAPLDTVCGPISNCFSGDCRTSLIAYYPFAEGSGSTSADATGNGHTATLSDVTWASPGITLDGNGDHQSYILMGSDTAAGGGFSLDATDGSFSFSLWINPQIAYGPLLQLTSTGQGDGFCFPVLGYDNRNNNLIAQLYMSDNLFLQAKTMVTAPAGVWTHIAVTWSSVTYTLSLYVNGSLAGATTYGTGPANGGGANYLLWGTEGSGTQCFGTDGTPHGLAHWPGGTDFAGTIDQIKIFDAELTANQVAGLAAEMH